MGDWVQDISAAPVLVVLAEAAVRGTILLLLAWGMTLVLRRASAALRHGIWMAALVGLLALPVLALTLPRWRVLPAAASQEVAVPAPEVPAMPVAARPVATGDAPPASSSPVREPLFKPEPATRSAAVPTVAPVVAADERPAQAEASVPVPAHGGGITAGQILLGVYLGGAVAMLLPVVLAPLWLRRLRRSARAVSDGGWLALLESLRGSLAIRRQVGLLRHDTCAVPLTYGIWRPVIMVPAEAAGWPEPRRRMALLHELAHIGRHDCLTQMVARVVRALFWFQPLVWVAVEGAQAECERACDDVVLGAGAKSSAYAETLLRYAAPGAARLPAGALAMARRATLSRRVGAILDGGQSRRRLSGGGLAGLLILLAGCAVPLAAAGRGQGTAEGQAGVPAKVDAFVVYQYDRGGNGGYTPAGLVVGTVGADGNVRVRKVKGTELHMEDGVPEVRGGQYRILNKVAETRIDLQSGKEERTRLAMPGEVDAERSMNYQTSVHGKQKAWWTESSRVEVGLNHTTGAVATQPQPAVLGVGTGMASDLWLGRTDSPVRSEIVLRVPGIYSQGTITNEMSPKPPIAWIDDTHFVTLYTSPGMFTSGSLEVLGGTDPTSDQKPRTMINEVIVVDTEAGKVSKLGEVEIGLAQIVVMPEEIAVVLDWGIAHMDGISAARVYCISRADALAGKATMEKRAARWGAFTLGVSLYRYTPRLDDPAAATPVTTDTLSWGGKVLGHNALVLVSPDGKKALWIEQPDWRVANEEVLYYMDSAVGRVQELARAAEFTLPVWTTSEALKSVSAPAPRLAASAAAGEDAFLVYRYEMVDGTERPTELMIGQTKGEGMPEVRRMKPQDMPMSPRLQALQKGEFYFYDSGKERGVIVDAGTGQSRVVTREAMQGQAVWMHPPIDPDYAVRGGKRLEWKNGLKPGSTPLHGEVEWTLSLLSGDQAPQKLWEHVSYDGPEDNTKLHYPVAIWIDDTHVLASDEVMVGAGESAQIMQGIVIIDTQTKAVREIGRADGGYLYVIPPIAGGDAIVIVNGSHVGRGGLPATKIYAVSSKDVAAGGGRLEERPAKAGVFTLGGDIAPTEWFSEARHWESNVPWLQVEKPSLFALQMGTGSLVSISPDGKKMLWCTWDPKVTPPMYTLHYLDAMEGKGYELGTAVMFRVEAWTTRGELEGR